MLAQILQIKYKHVKDGFKTYLTESHPDLEFENLSFNEFDIAFKSLKRNKAKAIDDINGNIIIDIYNVIKNILFRVFKASIG